MSQDEKPPKPIYVYVLIDPRYPDDVRYVGITNDMKSRFRRHIRDAETGKRNHRTCWVKSLLQEGITPLMTIIDETNNENWVQCEMEWIAYYRAIGCDLVNGTDGGDGSRGYVPSEETRRKLAEKGRHHSEESRQKISLKNKGKKRSDETRRKMSEYGKNRSDEHLRKLSESGKKRPPRSKETFRKQSANNPRRKPVLQYDKFGHFIRQWDSARQAGIQLGINPSNIRQCCKRAPHFNTIGGYVWRYADDPLLIEQTRLF